MKKYAFIMILLALIGRLVCCGQKVGLSSQINQLKKQQLLINKEIDSLLLQNAALLSITRLTDSKASLTKLMSTKTKNY